VNDVVVRGATVHDGTGADGRVADVAVADGRIVAVGSAAEAAATVTVDGEGLALAPGFVDVHSHDDFAVLLTPDMPFKVLQGVTTDVVGNCGMGAAPFEPAADHLPLFGAADRRDDLPRWQGYGGYLDALERDPPSLNVAVLVGHGTIRRAAMGDRSGPPTDAELATMRALLAEGLAAGAVGFSTGLIYEPGRQADTDELVALAREMAPSGGRYASHVRNEGEGLLDAVGEALRIGEKGSVGVQLSHHKASGRANWGRVRDSLALLDAARREGHDVTADQYPYTAGSTSLAAVVEHDRRGAGLGRLEAESIVLASAPRHPEWEGRSLVALGEDLGCPPAEAARRVVDAEGLGAVVVLHSMSEDDVRTVLRHPTTMIGSDGIPTPGGKPHPRLYGTFARVLGHYARDEGVLSLAEAVHRMTGMPAAAFGLADRGTIRVGAAADLVLFDPATIDDVATYDDPRRHPSGIRSVWVNGVAVVADGAPTGARPGRTLRRAA
jgi:N-acyl-D-amino-acid deacylase